jgi:hypothetical protein
MFGLDRSIDIFRTVLPTKTRDAIMGNKDMRKEKKKPKQPKEKPKASGSGGSGGIRPAK